jgi:C2 domain
MDQTPHIIGGSESSRNDGGDCNPSQGDSVEVERGGLQGHLKPKAESRYRRTLHDDDNPKKERRIGRLRRKLGMKSAASGSEGRVENSLEQSLDIDCSTEDTPTEGLKCHVPSFQDESSHMDDSDSEDHVETSNNAFARDESYDFNSESEQPELAKLTDIGDRQVSRGHHQGLPNAHAEHGAVVGFSNPVEWLRTKNTSSLSPTHIDRNMWPIDEKASAESEDQSEEEVKGEGNRVHQETTDKRKGFHLPTLRIQKKTGHRKVGDPPMPSPTNQAQVSADSVDEVDSKKMDLDQGGHISTPTKLRQRKPFGLKTPKSPGASQNESAFREDRQQGANKGLHLKFSRGQKPARDDEVHSPSTARREKVSEKIKRTLARGGLRDTRKESSGNGERDDCWEWGDSDTDNDEGISHKSRFESTLDGSQSIHDGLDPQARDILNFDTSGIPLPTVKTGVPLKLHQSKDTKELRVRPYHCFAPHRVYMTEDEIYQNMLRPSEIVEHVDSFVQPWCKIAEPELTEMERAHWGSPQDGRVGSLRVEVLSCVGISKHKADVSVYLVCGDAAFATDTIHGSRSPMWPACSKRAACFPIFHAYVTLYVGVFDVTTMKKSENDIFFGRVAVDVASLRPDSEYDVSLALRASSFVYDRRPRGVVRFRLCLHWFSERAAILSYLNVPKHMGSTCVESPSIPCADPKTFRNVAVTIHGQELPGKYTRKAFQATMREFNLYQQNIRVGFFAPLFNSMVV